MEQADVIRRGKELLAEIRKLKLERELIVVRAERKIAAITGKADMETAPHDSELLRLDGEILALIADNRGAFEKPRKVKTPDGSFGLQASTRVEIVDEDKALDAIFDRGYEECIRTTRTFVKDQIRKRLEEGERIPGCKMESGETASYTVASVVTDVQTLLDQEGAG